MAYTPDPEDTAQPTGNKAVSTAAPEFRALKAYIQSNLEDQDERDDAQDAAIALVQTNLNAVVAAQDARDDAQDVVIAGLGHDIEVVEALAKSKLIAVRLTSASGNWHWPAGVTKVYAHLVGGGTAGGAVNRTSLQSNTSCGFYSYKQAGCTLVAELEGSFGDIIPYIKGVGQVLSYDNGSVTVSQATQQSSTTFGDFVAAPAHSYTGFTYGQNNAAGSVPFYYSTRHDKGFTTAVLAGYVPLNAGSSLEAGSDGDIILMYATS